ncbi:hypothetical protein [Streptomyces sp. NPDC017435]
MPTARTFFSQIAASVAYHLANLEERGVLVRDGHSWQSSRLAGK